MTLAPGARAQINARHSEVKSERFAEDDDEQTK